ncbi:glycosyltransferase family 2 protein [Proteiniphilum sp. UBA5384]|uniref:glycosyltransferase family 2 protein n=1 Tax=Proteiniphilum sp. UBA5384 TaxID=1947279 RepID=UPI0025D50C23|nr:glycosyltransferase family 2 protein [Proteiniphilum sp. UBA5384]
MSLISIIIPVHNTAGYVRRCIDSVRNQTLQDIEIILVENLSTDGSSEICDEYPSLDSRIKVLHLDVADLSTARNAGIKVATSPYLGFIDSDDHIDPEMYESMLSALQVNKAEMVYCNLRYETENGEILRPFSDTGSIQVRPAEEMLKDIFRNNIDNSCCTKLYKRELFNTISFPEGFLFEDHSIIYKIVHLCDTVVHIDHVFYHYIQREESITNNWQFKKRYHFFLADYDRILFIRQHPIFSKEEEPVVVGVILKNCLRQFRDALLKANAREKKEDIPVMKEMLRDLLPIQKDELGEKMYKRLRKVLYFTFFYRNFYLLKRKLGKEKRDE